MLHNSTRSAGPRFLDYWKLSAGSGIPTGYRSAKTPIEREVERMMSVAFRTPGAALDAAEAFLRELDGTEHRPHLTLSPTCELVGCTCYSYLRHQSTGAGITGRVGCPRTGIVIDWRVVPGQSGDVVRRGDEVMRLWPVEWRAMKRWTEKRSVVVEGQTYQRDEPMEESASDGWSREFKFGKRSAGAHWFAHRKQIVWAPGEEHADAL